MASENHAYSKKSFIGLAFVMALFSMVFFSSGVLAVDCDATVTANNSIQDAIDNSNKGDVICVEAGNYIVPSGIEINQEDITLKAIGEVYINYSENETAESPYGLSGISVLANMGNVTVNGFIVSGFENGIAQSMSKSEGTTFNVIGNTVYPGYKNDGFYMRNGIQVSGIGGRVIGNTVIGALLTEDWAGTAIQIVNAKDVIVKNNVVTDTFYDIGISVLNWNSPIAVENITIRNNLVSNAQNLLRISGNDPDREISDVKIENNILIGPENNAVWIYGLNIQNAIVDNILLENNDISFNSLWTKEIRISSTSATSTNVIVENDNENKVMYVSGESELKSLLSSSSTIDVDVVKFMSDLDMTSQLRITRNNVTLDGENAGLIVKIDFGRDNSKKHLLGIFGNGVKLQNIKLDSSNLAYGVQAYEANNVKFENVTILNSNGAGLTVNGAKVIANNLETKDNSWGSVNVDPGFGVLLPSVFELVNGTLNESNQIWSDGANVEGTATVNVIAEGYNEYLSASGVRFWTNREQGVLIQRESNIYSFPSIQSAIDFADEGDTIEVAAGVYDGAVVNKSVKIIGSTEGNSIIGEGVNYKPGKSNLLSAFRPEVDGIEIRNFVFADEIDLGIYAIGINNLTVDSIRIGDTVQGITNWGGSNWTIINNVIESTTASNGGGIGIMLGAKAKQKCLGNLIQNNTVNAEAIAETYSTPGILLSFDTRYGEFEKIDGTEDISGNKIINNTVVAKGENEATGIEIGTILGDSESDPDRTNITKINLLVDSAALNNNFVENNIIDGVETGIYFYITTNLTITKNEIKNLVGEDIYADKDNSGTILNRNVLSSLNSSAFSQINATHNYWGTTSFLDINDSVEGNVSFMPICEDVACTRFIEKKEYSTNNSEEMFSLGILDSNDGNKTISVKEDLTFSIKDDGERSNRVILKNNTNLTREDGELVDVDDLVTKVNKQTYTVEGKNADRALKWGIEGAVLNFDPAITIEFFVGESLNGETLNIRRSTTGTGGWTDDGLVDKTCVVSGGYCSFKTNKASYYVAIEQEDTTSTGDSTGSSGRSSGGGSSGSGGGSCMTEWNCTDWSECVNGTQTRVCSYPENFCAPRDEKPEENRSCQVVEEIVEVEEVSSEKNKTGVSSLITGFAANVPEAKGGSIWILAIIAILIGGFSYYRYFTITGLSQRAEKLHRKADILNRAGKYDSSLGIRTKARKLQRKADRRRY